MIALLGIGILVSFVAALVLGIRLLRLASRTRGVPELALGTGFVVGGCVGLFLVLVGNAQANTGLPLETGELMFRIGMSLIGVGVSCTYIFVWQTFRPSSGLARGLVALGIFVIFASLWPLWTGPIEDALLHPVYLCGEAARLAGMVWGCVEAFRYHVIMRRRSVLGLADPVVTNRFLLWGIAMAAGIATVLVSGFISASGRVDAEDVVYLALAACTTVSPLAQWLAFFPPRAYSEWIGRRAAATA